MSGRNQYSPKVVEWGIMSCVIRIDDIGGWGEETGAAGRFYCIVMESFVVSCSSGSLHPDHEQKMIQVSDTYTCCNKRNSVLLSALRMLESYIGYNRKKFVQLLWGSRRNR